MTDAVAGLAPRPPIVLRTKLLYGLGAAANIIKQRGITTFLLLFYNQVLGLEAGLVGAVIMGALIFDAFADPMAFRLSEPAGARSPY